MMIKLYSAAAGSTVRPKPIPIVRSAVMRRNILIFHLGALGDFVLTWPVAMALGRLFPQCRIFYVTHPEKGQLAEKAIGVESISIEAGWHELFADTAKLSEAAQNRLLSAQTVISFLSNGNDKWASNVKRISPESLCIAVEPPARGEIENGQHAAAFIAAQFTNYPVLEEGIQKMLASIAERGIGRRSENGGEILIHPGSGAMKKCWPVERFIELGSQLKAAGHGVRFVIGEVEREQLGREIIGALSKISEVSQPKNLVELWQLIRSAKTFIGNDSGPAHLAGIMGVATVAIFGPTSSAKSWKPLGPMVTVVEGDWNEITVGKIVSLVKLLII